MLDATNLKCMYVYICPKKFITSISPRSILGNIGIGENTKDIYFGLVHGSWIGSI